MKAILITFDQAWYNQVVGVLSDYSSRGFTYWDEVKGQGSEKGDPHFGSHAWPSLCSVIIAIVEDDKVNGILTDLHALDEEREQLGLRAFVWNIEQKI